MDAQNPMNFPELKRYITKSMRMQHIYQPVMIKTLLLSKGQSASNNLRYISTLYILMSKLCERCHGKIQNTVLTLCGKCSRHCEWCDARLNQMNYAQSCGFCKSGEILGKATQMLGVDRISKSFLRTALSGKKE